LEGYGNILPGATNRIITMAEKQLEHRHHIESTVLKSNISNEKLGMWMAFILTFTLMLLGGYLIFNAKETAGYFTVFGPIVFHAANYIYNKKSDYKPKKNIWNFY
jgi:uncharacterized membrane protein